MDTFIEFIRNYYNRNSKDEWERLSQHRTEFSVSLRILQEYLPKSPVEILDCGGGPGRYALALAKLGYPVTLLDLSEENLKNAQFEAESAGVELRGYCQGNAVDLSQFPDEAFEAVLLFGPLYYMVEEADRRQAIQEAMRVLRPGGVLFAAFISRNAAHRWLAKHEPDKILTHPRVNDDLMNTGQLMPVENHKQEFCGYLAKPEDVVNSFWEAGMEVENIFGVEGLVSLIEDQVNQTQGEVWEKWVDLNYRAANDPSLHGGVEHLVIVSRKPAWKKVLKMIARKLDQEGITYHVVGGTSVALQGVRIKVNDLDLELDKEGAFRFQVLFSDYVQTPVRFCEDQYYSSYLGVFQFYGVKVEIIGDIHRNDQGCWVATGVKTNRMIDLEDQTIRVSWIEEETLAYIRRNRMQRAVQCLEKCDQKRLLAVLCGEEEIGVL